MNSAWGASTNQAFRTGTQPFGNQNIGYNPSPGAGFTSFSGQPAQPFAANSFTTPSYGTNPSPGQNWGVPQTGFPNPTGNSFQAGGMNTGFQNTNPAGANPFSQPSFGTGFMQSNPSLTNPSNISNNPSAFTGTSFPPANPGFQTAGFNSTFNQTPGFTAASSSFTNPNPTSTFNQGSFSVAASSFTGGANPPAAQGSLFNTGSSFTGLNMGMTGAFNAQTAGLKYKPTSVREETSNINILHICALPEIQGKSVEEQRFLEYKQKGGQAAPQGSMSNTSLLMPGTSMPALNTSPFSAANLTQQASLFNKPVENKPAGSLFSMQPSQPSLFNTATSTPSLFSTAPASSAFNPNPAPTLAPANTSLFNPSNTSSFFSGQAQNTGSTLFSGTSLASNSLFQPKPATPTFNQPQQPDIMPSAYRDPHGLNWLHSDIIPETVIKSYKERYAAQLTSDPISVVERIFKPKRVNNYPQILTEKWKSTQEKKSLKSSSGFDLLYNRKTEPFFVNKRTNFINLKLEQYKDEDGGKYFKCPGSTQRSSETLIEICVKAHDPNPIKLLIQVTPEKTIREIKLEISRHLPDVDENSIQLIYKSKILSPLDTVRSLGISQNDELTVINAPLIHNNSLDFPATEMLPKIPENYRIRPSIVELARMTVNELKAIEDFTIENQYGRIKFDGLTNVLGLDVGKIIEIKDKEIIGYPDESGVVKPEIGKELNKPCEVTLFNFQVSGNRDRVEQKLRTMCQRWNMEYKSYDYETAELVVRIKHF